MALAQNGLNTQLKIAAWNGGAHVAPTFGGDTLRGLGGNDGLNAGEGDNLLYGGLDADRLFAGDGDDLLYGGAGNDELIGSGGRDRVSGGGGTDTFYVGGGGRFTVTTVNLATGKAVLDGDNTSVLSGIEDVVGDSGRDALTGDAGANRLEGFTGDDTLLGGAGNDTLYGSLGADLMNGGGGVDVFLYRDAAESKADRNIDQIDGFALAQDIIDLSLIDASPGGDDSAFVFIGSAAFSGSGPQVRIVVDGVAQTTTVQVRLDGSVADDMTILLDNDLALTAANFVL